MTVWFDGYEQFYNGDSGHDNMLFVFRNRDRVVGSLAIYEYDSIAVEHHEPHVYKEAEQ